MTQLETIRMIGDVLTQIDIIIGSLPTSDPKQRELADLRLLLDDRQRTIASQVFDENTERFQRAADDLRAVNQEVQATIGDINRLNTTIQNVTRFLNAVTSLLSTIGVLV
jgi:ABC-type transporter Mla subunit MlaD